MLLRQVIGVILIAVGFMALFIPIIPGGVIIFLGIEIAGFVLLKDKLALLKTQIKKIFIERRDVNR